MEFIGKLILIAAMLSIAWLIFLIKQGKPVGDENGPGIVLAGLAITIFVTSRLPQNRQSDQDRGRDRSKDSKFAGGFAIASVIAFIVPHLLNRSQTQTSPADDVQKMAQDPQVQQGLRALQEYQKRKSSTRPE